MSDEQIASNTPQADETKQADGDYVPYGYGHPAHKPDPNARYGFDPGISRPLPVRAERRWRVPG